jgi:site-specific DNA recombinase
VAQYAERVNRALGLLRRVPPPAVLRTLARRYRVSPRQARRYVEAAQQHPLGLPVPEATVVFTVKLPEGAAAHSSRVGSKTGCIGCGPDQAVEEGHPVKTAAIYARVSSDRQKEAQTITSQTSALRAYAAGHGYLVPEGWVYEDEGWSGATLVRPGLERVRDLAAQGQVESLLVYSPDRLSRKYAYQVLLLEEFARAGVDVVFVRAPRVETPEEVLLVQFQGMIAEDEKAQISERTRPGKRHRARSGVVNALSGAPYGYRYVRKTDGEEARHEVLEPEAAVVRDVFRRDAEEACSIGAITRWLTDGGIPTRAGKPQGERSTAWGMLRNPAYQGTACFQKTAMTPREHVRVTRRLRQRGDVPARPGSLRDRPREEWIEIPVPALVTPTQYALAQVRLAENRRFAARHTKVPSLLQGLWSAEHAATRTIGPRPGRRGGRSN